MQKYKKQAFTLVELIVVITILAILGTIAFINLSGYSSGARDSKRVSDINNIIKKIGIEEIKGEVVTNFISDQATNAVTINSIATNAIQGTPNFTKLKEDGNSFKDPATSGNYVLSYAKGGTSTGAYKFTQISTINEETNSAVVKGNYYMMQTGDSPSIVKNSAGDFVVDGGAYLPYDIFATNNNSQLLASMQIGDTFGSHTCVLLVNGKVKCVGRNNYGQLGDGTTTLSMTPVEVIGITDATYIDGGDTTNCAILSDKTVKCWGRGTGGQLGNGGSTNSSTPVQVSGLTNVEKLSVGRDFSCVILTNGDVKCWGANDMGRLANGTISTNSLIYNDVPGITNAISISAGDDHVCSVLSNGTVYCWGANWSGQLGDGTNNQSSVPVSVSGISNATSVFVVSDESSCAILVDKTVKCWGANWSGQLGNGTTTNSNIPVSVTGLANVEKITGGYGNFSTILTDGTVKSWGINGFGQLGDGTNVDKTTPVSIPGLSNVVNIAGGWGHVCALLNGGVVKCWGINDSGQFGDGTATSSYTPVDMQGL